MKTLLIFDASIRIKKLKIPSSVRGKEGIYLFPLTSKSSVIKEIENCLREKGCTARMIPTAEMISSRDMAVRDKYIKFVSDISQVVCRDGKNLKEIFKVEKNFSLWWLSLIAEKNVYKSNSFNRLVQMDSIVSEIFKVNASEVIFSAAGGKLKNALAEFCASRGISFKTLRGQGEGNLTERIFWKKSFLYIKHGFLLFAKAIFLAIRIVCVKRNFVFFNKKRRAAKLSRKVMIITPYPDFDEKSASVGEFKNRYYGRLREALDARGEEVLWISMYVRNTAVSFKKSLRYARKFVKNDTSFFMLEEFSSFRVLIKAFRQMIVSAIKFAFLRNKIREASSFGEFNIYTFFEDDWYSSFAGAAGLSGLVQYYTFKELFKKTRPKKCLYPCEMRAWEKALIAARESESKKTTLFAGQFGTVPKMHLNFFNYRDEIENADKYSMPRPDKILCNGSLSCESIGESGWLKDKTNVVEALRYTYLKECLEQDFSSRKKNVVILLLSISAEESSSILSVSYEAFKDMKDVEVWIKPHPFLNLDKVFRLAGIKKEDMSFKVKHGSLKGFLTEALVAVTGESSAAVEALAFGCRVLIVDTPEWINLSPLRFVETDIVKTISSSESLRQETENILKDGSCPVWYDEEKRRVVNEFFCLNPTTDVPERFVKVLKSKSPRPPGLAHAT